jgi:uncharacterized protein YcbX
MALIETRLTSGTLILSANGAGQIEVPRLGGPSAAQRTVSVWRSAGLQAEDCGEAAAKWLSGFLGLACRLVRAGPAFERSVAPYGNAAPGDLVTFADAYPFLILSEASLADLNLRLIAKAEAALPLDRFRPNFLVSGCDAFAEDKWSSFRIGSVVFRAAGPCERCSVTTTNQQTAAVGQEPLRMLATYRRSAGGTSVHFGQNLMHVTKAGELRVGDPVELLT